MTKGMGSPRLGWDDLACGVDSGEQHVAWANRQSFRRVKFTPYRDINNTDGLANLAIAVMVVIGDNERTIVCLALADYLE